MSTQKIDPSRILEVGRGFMASRVLLSAVELGVFTHLSAGPATGHDLAARLGLHERSAADFLDALVALGFLAREGLGPDARYSNTPETAAYLDRASPQYLGGLLEMFAARLYPFWSQLTTALRTGEPQNEIARGDGDLFAALYAEPARLEQFVSAMRAVQMGNFAALSEQFDFGRYGTVCDVGGASGALAIAVARQHPLVACVTFDLPPVEPLARAAVAAAGLAGRIEVRSGDFMRDPLPRAAVITMGNILHDWGLETKRMLIRKAYEALPEGGVFIAIESVIDDERRHNLAGLLMSLNMLIETPAGFDYTRAQFDTWCREAGFRSTELMPLTGPSSAAIAYK